MSRYWRYPSLSAELKFWESWESCEAVIVVLQGLMSSKVELVQGCEQVRKLAEVCQQSYVRVTGCNTYSTYCQNLCMNYCSPVMLGQKLNPKPEIIWCCLAQCPSPLSNVLGIKTQTSALYQNTWTQGSRLALHVIWDQHLRTPLSLGQSASVYTMAMTLLLSRI